VVAHVASTPADFAVIGAGCIGASTAFHLARAGHSVVVYDKEPGPAYHQSGRNSGVIHAGYNLRPGSAKARFCVDGNRRMRAYCRARGVPMLEGGILVVATDDEQRLSLAQLLADGRANGVAVRPVHGDGIADVEPHAVGVAALHAPEGASVDSAAYVRALVEDAATAGARFRFGMRVRRADDIPERVVVNASGLQADRLAAAASHGLRVVPFRGAYAHLRPTADRLVRSHVYAAPDPRFPFLGVHLSRGTDGIVAAGPGALLALARESYTLGAVRACDAAATLTWPGFWRLFADRAFRRHARQEIAKSLSLGAVWREARRLVPALRRDDLVRDGAGNRAQLVQRDGTLVEDIVVREVGRELHVLNAVSPGLTCSLPFGEHLAARAAAML
jgi:L-2-hydroxyglutarate oxidase